MTATSSTDAGGPTTTGGKPIKPSRDPRNEYRSGLARLTGIYIVVVSIIGVFFLAALWPPPTIPAAAIDILDADARGIDSVQRALTDTLFANYLKRPPIPFDRWVADSSRLGNARQLLDAQVNIRRRITDSLRLRRADQILHQTDIRIFGKALPDISLDLRLILLGIVAGVLGGFVHAAQSFAGYVGNKTFRLSWMWWYGLRPLIGGVLGGVLYFFVRSSLFPNLLSASAEVSPFGVAAMGAIAGLCSKQATDKLDELFTALFRLAPGSGAGDAGRGDTVTGEVKPPGEASATATNSGAGATPAAATPPGRPPEAAISDEDAF